VSEKAKIFFSIIVSGQSENQWIVVGRVARFFLVQNTKTRKKYTKLPRTVPNVQKMEQKTLKWTKRP
jgi:hypothetical protein